MTVEADELKRLAATAAVAQVEDGMVLGLGSGSTATLALELLAERVARGRTRVVGIPTSKGIAALARRLGVPLAGFAQHRRIDLTIDGADQVEERTLYLVKGLGGALLREKIVAAASRRMVVVVDEGKLVTKLGAHTPLPVEIVAFGWQTMLDRIAAMGVAPKLRTTLQGKPFRTDGGNYIADCNIANGLVPAELEQRLTGIVGVVEVGLFIGLATEAMVGTRKGLKVLERSGTSSN